jgi:hypothetical protein
MGKRRKGGYGTGRTAWRGGEGLNWTPQDKILAAPGLGLWIYKSLIAGALPVIVILTVHGIDRLLKHPMDTSLIRSNITRLILSILVKKRKPAPIK